MGWRNKAVMADGQTLKVATALLGGGEYVEQRTAWTQVDGTWIPEYAETVVGGQVVETLPAYDAFEDGVLGGANPDLVELLETDRQYLISVFGAEHVLDSVEV